MAEQIAVQYESTLWYALMGPAGLPAGVVKRLHAETVKALKTPGLSDQLLALGAEPIGNSPQELAKFIKVEIDRWTQLIEKADIRID